MAKIQVAVCLLVAFTVMLSQVEAGYLYPKKELYGESSIPIEHKKHT